MSQKHGHIAREFGVISACRRSTGIMSQVASASDGEQLDKVTKVMGLLGQPSLD